jgi:membrane-associated phospholipid phosphatase
MYLSRTNSQTLLLIFAWLVAMLLIVTNLTISFSYYGVTLLVGVVASLFYTQVYTLQGSRLDRAVAFLQCISLLSAASMLGGLASYALASLSVGWRDDEFIAIDTALGFDWLNYWNFVQSHPFINATLDFAYTSIFYMPTVILIALLSDRKDEHAYRFAAGFIIALLMTETLLAFFPAKSAAQHFLAIGALNMPTPGFAHIAIIEQLRAGTLKTIDLGHMAGLIAFPSFHSVACILFAWASWPVRWIRWPSLLLNVLMLASTPIQGGHYLTDTLGGVLVAIAAIIIANRLASTILFAPATFTDQPPFSVAG